MEIVNDMRAAQIDSRTPVADIKRLTIKDYFDGKLMRYEAMRICDIYLMLSQRLLKAPIQISHIDALLQRLNVGHIFFGSLVIGFAVFCWDHR